MLAALVACNFVLGLPPQPLVHQTTDSHYPTFPPQPPGPWLPCALPKLEVGQAVQSWPASVWVVYGNGAKTAPLLNPSSLKAHASRRASVGAQCDCRRAKQAAGKVYCPVPRADDLDQWPQVAQCVPKSER